MGAELTELVFDSLLGQAGAALVRDARKSRLLFPASELTIEVEVISTGSSCGLIDQLITARRAELGVPARDTGGPRRSG
jgi:hypothetical protein